MSSVIGKAQTRLEKYAAEKRAWKAQMVRLDHRDAGFLKKFSKKTGKSQAELIRRYVSWGLENDGAYGRVKWEI